MSSHALSRWFCAVACASTVAAVASRALAQTDDSQREHAIAIGQGAIELYEQGQYGVALERFRTAERALHSPVFALYEARCLEKLGRLVESKRAYELLAGERLPPDAPPAWRAALSDAALELPALVRRVPSASVTVSGAVPAALALDGAPLDIASSGSELWLDPGAHVLEARDKNGRTALARFELKEGQRNQPVHLMFPAETAPAVLAPVVAARAPAPTPAAHTSAVSNPATDTLGIVLLSTAGAGIVTGAVTGLMAMAKTQRIRENCVGNSCLTSDEAEGQAAETLALFSTIGFAVGGASLGAWSLRVLLTPAASGSGAFSAPPSVRVAGVF